MDHSYYNMNLYKVRQYIMNETLQDQYCFYFKLHKINSPFLAQHNADGSYDGNHVDMTDSHVHEFLSNHSQGSQKEEEDCSAVSIPQN